MTSRKRSSKKKTSPQSSSGNPCTNEEIVPKEEFEVEQEAPATQHDLTLSSRTSPAYLKTLREFYRVPRGVVFRVPAILNVAALQNFLGGYGRHERP
ncbi:BnaC07g15530D [Brassica napus]|uniref:BnaC07g15530D protein n=1 Tax=Brassica napus TaxID=3708 RepID=A0A078I363_BRANA|nr:BnaC07g15530D [Brassica napus]